MVDEITDTSSDTSALRTKRDEILRGIKPAPEPKLTSSDVYESLGETERLNVLEAKKKQTELELARADRESRTARELSQKYESQYKDIPEFKPTPESKADLIGLFGLIGAIGAFGGGKSYGSALGAMNAMGGMLKGYREGRKELFEREKAEFDKNMIAIKAHNDKITAAFSRAKELAKTNLPMAERKLFTELKEMEANALATNLYKKGLMETDKMRIEAMNRANAQTDQALKTVASINKALGETSGGQTIYASIDGVKGYYSAAQLRQATANGQSVEQIARPTDRARTTASDEELEKTAQGIASLAFKAPGLNNRNRDKIMARVREINPNFNEGDFGNIQAAERQWTSPNGFGAKQITAFNTVYNHLETIEKLGKALENNDIQATNRLINTFRTALGHPEVTNFDAARQAVASEIVKAITGTAGALADRQEAERILASYNSPEQTEGVVQTLRELIGGRYAAAERQYVAGTRRTKEDFRRFLPESVNEYFSGYGSERSTGRASGGLTKAPQSRIDQARAALNRGVPRSEVIKTLNSLGFSDEGL